MADDLFLDLLLKLSAVRLREMRQQVDQKMQRLRFEADYLDRALKQKGGGGGGGQGSGSGAGQSSTPRKTRQPNAQAARSANKQESIRSVMDTDPDRTWLPSEIRDHLIEQGVDTTSGGVRNTMKRMLDLGELERPSDGGHGFRLASATNGQSPSPADAETLDLAGTGGEAP